MRDHTSPLAPPPIMVILSITSFSLKISSIIFKFRATPSSTDLKTSFLLCSILRPIKAPLASGFHHGLLSPRRQGKKIRPFEPIGDFSTKASIILYGLVPDFSASKFSIVQISFLSQLSEPPALCIVPHGVIRPGTICAQLKVRMPLSNIGVSLAQDIQEEDPT